MGDQPRWPDGTPVAPSGKGPGAKVGTGKVGEGKRHMPKPRDWSPQDWAAALETLNNLVASRHGGKRTWWGGMDFRVLTAADLQDASDQLNMDLQSLRAFVKFQTRS